MGGRARAFDMFDFITDKGQPIQSLTLNAEGQFTESLPVGAPFVFKFKTLSDLFRDGEGLKGEMDAFVQSYTAASNKRRTTKGRAARGIAQQYHPVLYDAVRKALPANLGLLYEVNSEQIDQSMWPHAFGCTQSFKLVATEKFLFPCLRVTITGTRKVGILSAMQLESYMRDSGISGVITTSRMSSFVKSMTQASWVKFFDSSKVKLGGNPLLHWATCGPDDALFLPGFCVICEAISEQADMFGVRIGVLTQDATFMESANHWHNAWANHDDCKSCAEAIKTVMDLVTSKASPPLKDSDKAAAVTPCGTTGDEDEEEAKGDGEGDSKESQQQEQ